MPPSLTEPQFQILNALRLANGPLTQRRLTEETTLSLGTVNSHVRELEALGLIADRTLTDAGLDALAPHKVDNAVILAAGLSSRFAPISYEQPKGTLRVRGEILVERQIKQLREAGIEDITLVVGYRKEHFFTLARRHKVRLVVNTEYASRNNNGSLWLVREELGNTYVCSSDDYFTINPFEAYVYQAYYSAQYVAGPTKEWCIQTGAGGRITGATIGGADAWTMLGHAYFDRAFSTSFRAVLEEVYGRPETTPLLWESIYLAHVDDLSMVVRQYPDGVIHEFDSLDEVSSFDPHFMENLDSEIFNTISRALGCEKSEISDFRPLKQGITNLSCHFTVGDAEYVYRHPGAGTDKMVDRYAELEALEAARRIGIDQTFIAGDPVKGWKISRYVPNVRNLDVTDDDELRAAMSMSRLLHTSGEHLSRSFDFVTESLRYEALLASHGPIEVPGYAALREKILRLKSFVDADGFERVPSHNDFFPPNFLVSETGRIDLIDWEYAGTSDVAADFGTMVVCTEEMDTERADRALKYYFGRPPSQAEHRHFWSYVTLAGWCWYVWALAREAEGDDVGAVLLTYYQHAVGQIDDLLRSYEKAGR